LNSLEGIHNLQLRIDRTKAGHPSLFEVNVNPEVSRGLTQSFQLFRLRLIGMGISPWAYYDGSLDIRATDSFNKVLLG
jgi:hypothetical protein